MTSLIPAALSSVYDWQSNFDGKDSECLQFVTQSWRNHVLIIACDPLTAETSSVNFRGQFPNVQFTFARKCSTYKTTSTTMKEISETQLYTNLVFALCYDMCCPQCINARDLRTDLSKQRFINDDHAYFYKVKNVLKKGRKLIYSRVITTSGWRNFIEKMVDDGLVQNTPNVKFLILSGTHRTEDGDSYFEDRTLYEEGL